MCTKIQSVTKYSLIWDHGYAEWKEGSGPSGPGYRKKCIDSVLTHRKESWREPRDALEPYIYLSTLIQAFQVVLQDFSATQCTLYTLLLLRRAMKHLVSECHIRKKVYILVLALMPWIPTFYKLQNQLRNLFKIFLRFTSRSYGLVSGVKFENLH